MKKKRKSLFDYITAFMGVVWLVSACSAENPSWLQIAVCAVSTLWLAMYVLRTDKQGGDC